MGKSSIKIGAVKVSGTNTGAGIGLYAGSNPFNNFNFKSLVAAGSIDIISGASTVTISGGSGGGTTTANNGLTKIGDNIVLGGTLTGDTNISGTSTLYIGNTISSGDSLNYGGFKANVKDFNLSYNVASSGVSTNVSLGGYNDAVGGSGFKTKTIIDDINFKLTGTTTTGLGSNIGQPVNTSCNSGFFIPNTAYSIQYGPTILGGWSVQGRLMSGSTVLNSGFLGFSIGGKLALDANNSSFTFGNHPIEPYKTGSACVTGYGLLSGSAVDIKKSTGFTNVICGNLVGGVQAYACACAGDGHLVGALAWGDNVHANGNSTTVLGRGSTARGLGAFAGGYYGNNSANNGHGPNALAGGSFIHQYTNSNNPVNYGVTGRGSAILGGLNSHLTSTCAVLLGGVCIQVTGASYNNHTIVSDLAIWNSPTVGTTGDTVLVWDSTDKKVKNVTQSSLGGGGGTADGVVSGATLNVTTLELSRTEGLGDVTVDLTQLIATPSAPINSIQFNNGGSFSGDSNFTYSGESLSLGTRATGSTLGKFSIGTGLLPNASGTYSFAMGFCSLSQGHSSFAQGIRACATQTGSHAEGRDTQALSGNAHAEGRSTIASGYASHTEGDFTCASANFSHAEGCYTKATALASHAEGGLTLACGFGSHAGGFGNQLGNNIVVAGGFGSFNHSTKQNGGVGPTGAMANWSAILGGYEQNIEVGNYGAVLLGGCCINLTGTTYRCTVAVPNLAIMCSITQDTASDQVLVRDVATGHVRYVSKASLTGGTGGGSTSPAGADTQIQFNSGGTFGATTGFTFHHINDSLTLGTRKTGSSIGVCSFSQGTYNVASGQYSHAEGGGQFACLGGLFNCAIGNSSHAEGVGACAIGNYSHAEGSNTCACGDVSHAEGAFTIAIGSNSHSSGRRTCSMGDHSHSSGLGADDSNKLIFAGGCASFNHSTNTISQTSGHGALADRSAILGGINHNIESGNTNAVIIGGKEIKLTGTTYVDFTAVDNLAIMTEPTGSTIPTDVILLRSSNGIIKKASNEGFYLPTGTTAEAGPNGTVGGRLRYNTDTNTTDISDEHLRIGGTPFIGDHPNELKWIENKTFNGALSNTTSASFNLGLAVSADTTVTWTVEATAYDDTNGYNFSQSATAVYDYKVGTNIHTLIGSDTGHTIQNDPNTFLFQVGINFASANSPEYEMKLGSFTTVNRAYKVSIAHTVRFAKNRLINPF